MKLLRLIPSAIILALGFGVTITGALFKIQHWPYGSEILIFGTLLKLIAIFVVIIALIKMYRQKSMVYQL